MKWLIVALILLAQPANARDYVYHGTWVTREGRALNGNMTCILTPAAKHRYNGRFYGVWQGVAFDYTVPISGPIQQLKGQALIDGASYDWAGWVTKDQLKANFTGSRYGGSFDLRRYKGAEKK